MLYGLPQWLCVARVEIGGAFIPRRLGKDSGESLTDIGGWMQVLSDAGDSLF